MRLFPSRPLLLAVLLGAALPAHAAIDADHADDICTPEADPCVITELVRIETSTLLDFGLRTVELTGNGRLDIGSHNVTVRCGDFVATTEGTAVDARGFEDGAVEGGDLTIQARRACEIADPARPCLNDANCDLGVCAVHVCTGSERRTCATDANCQLGACLPFGTSGRCQGNFSTICATNADCDLGTCPAEFFCSSVSNGKRGCTVDTDCDLGTCSVGTASIALGGGVEGRAAFPADVELEAADSIVVTAPINLSSRARQGDGGRFQASATFGSVSLYDIVRARGGIAGGWHDIEAGGDILLAGRFDLDGGDFDGGLLEVTSGGNVTIEGSIRANARNGQGYGGEVIVRATGDVELRPGPDGRKMLISANGHGDRFGESGDGGYLDFTSEEGDVLVREGVKIVSNAGSPGGIGGETYFDADGHVQFDGELYSRGRGSNSEGGDAYFLSIGSVELGPTSVVDVEGTGGGGEIEIDAGDDVLLAGVARATGPIGTDAGEIQIDAGDLVISGQLLVNGADEFEPASIEVDACRIDLLPGAALLNEAPDGLNELQARESMRLHEGSQMLAQSGINRLAYRTDEKPPVVDGVVDTSAVLVLRDDIFGCPVCGNSEIDQFEECDDGNLTDYDGCSVVCRLEID